MTAASRTISLEASSIRFVASGPAKARLGCLPLACQPRERSRLGQVLVGDGRKTCVERLTPKRCKDAAGSRLERRAAGSTQAAWHRVFPRVKRSWPILEIGNGPIIVKPILGRQSIHLPRHPGIESLGSRTRIGDIASCECKEAGACSCDAPLSLLGLHCSLCLMVPGGQAPSPLQPGLRCPRPQDRVQVECPHFPATAAAV